MSEVSGYSARDQFSNPMGGTKKTSGSQYNVVFEDDADKSVSVDDFLNLMVAQLQNQDFMNPVDDTQYVTQLAQFATMQQMQELAAYSKSNYAMSLVGKNVTVAKFNVSGGVDKVSGPVEKLSLVNDEYQVYVGGKPYTMDQIMEVNGLISDSSGKVDASKYSVTATVDEGVIKLSWPTAISDGTVSDDLTYSVYYTEGTDADSANFDTVEDVEKGNQVIADAKNINSETIKGLTPGKTYFVNVVVKDPSGNKSVYKKATVYLEK